MQKLLSEFKPNQKGVVKQILSCCKLKRRLYDMGITPDVEICVNKLAPLGDPMQIDVRGYYLTIRKSDAKSIIMEEIV